MATITYGIPVYDDAAQLRWTLMTLRLFHPGDDLELLVVDNHPQTEQRNGRDVWAQGTASIKRLVEGLGGRYVPMAEPVGTAPPRNRIFAEASGEIVVVTDSHVILQAGAFDRIREYFDDPSHAQDIVQGPRIASRMQDDGGLQVDATHYANVFRSGMQGIWSQAFGCPCGRWNFDVRPDMSRSEPAGIQVSEGKIEVAPAAQPPTCTFHSLDMDHAVVTECPQCGRELPRQHPYQQHWMTLANKGYGRRCWNPEDTEPFDIPGLGLGMFACKREAWPGFPEEMRGFGGGELNLHEAFRLAGGRGVCLPGAGWWHSFYREAGKVTYPLTLWSKVRNYVLWANQLGQSLDAVHRHFVIEGGKGGQLNQRQWDHLIADPVRNDKYPHHLKNGKPEQAEPTIESVYQNALKTKCDIEHHLPTVRRLAEQCNSVLAITKRSAWDVAILAAGPQRYDHRCARPPKQPLNHLVPECEYTMAGVDDLGEPWEVDILLLDYLHTAEHLREMLKKYGDYVRKWIVKTSVVSFGSRGEDKGEGLDAVIDEFIRDRPAWHRVFFDAGQRGLVVLSCNALERDIDQLPGTILHSLFKLIGVEMAEGCACRRRIAQMNEWGVEGCRKHRQEIVDALKEDQGKYSWGAKFKAAIGSIRTGLAFKLHPFDPLGSLYDESVRRAEAYEQRYLANCELLEPTP